MKSEILGIVSRDGKPERWLRGWLQVRTASNLFTIGEEGKFFARSLLKPFQLLPFLDNLTHFSLEQIAIGVGSHSGELLHRTVLESWPNGIDFSQMVLKKSASLGRLSGQPGENGTDYWLHPCSGKHALIFSLLQLQGLNPNDYSSKNGPYQVALADCLSSEISREKTSINWGVDGCGLQTPYLSIDDLSLLYFGFVNKSKYRRIREAMKRNPRLVGGTSRLDSDLIAAHKELYAKEGADGLTAIGVESESAPFSIILKLEAGYDPRVSRFLIEEILFKIKGVTKNGDWGGGQSFDIHSGLSDLLESARKELQR